MQKWSEREETPRELISEYGWKELNMSYMTYADDLATIEMLEGDYVKEALETDRLLDECLNRCNLERHMEGNRCACLADWDQGNELKRLRRRRTGSLESSHRLGRTWAENL